MGMTVKESLQRSARSALTLVLLLASGAAAALGLGQLEMKSKMGEPFLAEIPIVSSDPAELEQLEARVPSADTFARIGLQGPDEIVSSLRFTSALDGRGRPVIRVTSEQPINEPLLTFLVEVEWGQGRLVREYSALVAAPRAVDAPLQPAIQAPVAAPSNAIVRAPVAPPSAPAPAVVAPPQQPAVQPIAPAPRPASTPVVAVPAPAPASASALPTEYGPAKSGDSLSEIARDLDLGVSLEQAMVALLRANPDAFINGDINQLKRGAVLRVPQPAEVSRVDAGEAGELVRNQMQRFQDARRPVVAPDPPPAPAQAVAARPSTSTPPATAPSPARAAASPRARGARLEIVPPGARRARNAGTQSGLAAGGEGTMLRQETDQAREALAARDVELTEMRARVGELEKLQQQQQQLIALKDSQLAAAQQRMAQTQAETAPAPTATGSNPWPWLLGGVVLLALLTVAAWVARRQARARQFRAPATGPAARPRSIADSFGDDVLPPRGGGAKSMAGDATPTTGPADPVATGAAGLAVSQVATSGAAAQRDQRARRSGPLRSVEMSAPLPAVAVEDMRDPDVADRVESAQAERLAPVASSAPSTTLIATPVRATSDAPSGPVAPTWHAATRAGVAPSTSSPGPDSGARDTDSSHERLELARAYLALGDSASARQLLVELVVNGGQASRQQASRLLGELD